MAKNINKYTEKRAMSKGPKRNLSPAIGFETEDEKRIREMLLNKRTKMQGGGLAMRGYGKAYMKGGRVGYRGGTLVGKGRRRGGAGGKSGQQ